jgi:hypothetical protein
MYYHVMESFNLTLFAIMFLKLCFSFMYVFAFLNPHVVYCFSLSRLLFELCNLITGGSI